MATILDQLPVGTILGWNSDSLPSSKWQVCDGTNGTPNLINRFPIGTTAGLPSRVRQQIGVDQEAYAISGTTDNGVYGGPFYKGFETQGPDLFAHSHNFSTSIVVKNMPPATFILFIVKILN